MLKNHLIIKKKPFKIIQKDEKNGKKLNKSPKKNDK